jgi:uncharacterized protein YjeT (DUF2065 family)
MLEKVFLAFALVLAFEGALYALFPTFLRSIMKQLEQVDDAALRQGGVVALSLGVGLVWLLK